MFKIIPFMVQEKYRRILTIDRVLGMLKSNHFAENYMQEKLETHVTNHLLYKVIITIDPGLFFYTEAEIDETIMSKQKALKEFVIELDPAMEALLTKFAIERRGNPNPKSLDGLGRQPGK